MTIQYFSLATATDSRKSLDGLAQQLNRLESELATVGASQSRLNVATNVLQSTVENYTAARSRIVDVDVAAESSKYIRASVLQKAASSVLAQSNLNPKIVLSLLRDAGDV